MKTIYCLGRSPQFKLPCVKYKYLIRNDESHTYNSIKIPKNDSKINDYGIDEIKNMDLEEKKELAEQMLDHIYPSRAINRCMKINNKNKIKIKKYLKDLKHSYLERNNRNKKEINKQNSVKDKKINERYKSSDSKSSKIINNFDDSHSENINSENKTLENKSVKFKNNKYSSESNMNKKRTYKINLSQKLFNYNYPIFHDENSNQFSRLMNKKYSSCKGNIKSNSLEDKNMFNKSIKPAHSTTINTNTLSNKKRNKGIQLNTIGNKNDNFFYPQYLGTIFGDTIEKMKRKKGETQANELNIIYSETKEQFYKKYDKYRKNENLKGLGLANINYPPKIKFKELNKKISEIKKKVANVKSIVDSTFPKVLAYMTWTKKEYENSMKKKGFNSPYKQKLNMMEKHQKYINLYLSSPIEIISRNKNCL